MIQVSKTSLFPSSTLNEFFLVFKALDEYATLDFKRSAPKVAVDDERREKASIGNNDI